MVDAVRDGSLQLPMPASVAFFLVDRWFGGGLRDVLAGRPR
jgi:hypothetical protein